MSPSKSAPTTVADTAATLGVRPSDVSFRDTTVVAMARLYATMFDIQETLARRGRTLTDLSVDCALGTLSPQEAKMLSLYEFSRRDLATRQTMWSEYLASTDGTFPARPVEHDARELSRSLPGTLL